MVDDLLAHVNYDNSNIFDKNNLAQTIINPCYVS